MLESSWFSMLEPQWNKNDISTHAIFHKGSIISAGTAWNYLNSRKSHLSSIIWSSTTSPSETKRFRIYQTINDVISTLQLSENLVYLAMHVYDKIEKMIPKRTFLMNIENLSAVLIYFSARQMKFVVFKDELVESLGISEKLFNRCLFYMKPIYLQMFRPEGGKDSSESAINRVGLILCELLGPGDYMPIIRAVNKKMAKGLVNMREDMRAAVIAFIASRLLIPGKAFLTSIAKMVHCRLASLYNAITRVLCKSGINVSTKLSQVDVVSSLKDIIQEFPDIEPSLEVERTR